MICDACTVVCVAGVYIERVQECDNDRNAGVGAGGDVVSMSAGVSIWVVHMVPTMC